MGFELPARRRIGAALLVSAAVSASSLLTVQALAAPVVRAQAANTVEATPDNQFKPAKLEIPVGTKVTWTNPAKGFHSVTGGTPSAKDTSTINQPTGQFETYEVTFEKAGTFPYFCEPHAPAMAGEIVVLAKGAGPAAGGTASPKGESSPTAGPSESSDAASSPTPRAVEGEEEGEGGGEGTGSDGHEEIPGIEDNEVLQRIHAEEASNDKQVKGFQTLLWAMVAAMVALGLALFFSTRPRRANR